MRARSTTRSGFLMLGLGNEAPDACILSAEAVVQTDVHKFPLRFAPVQPSSPRPVVKLGRPEWGSADSTGRRKIAYKRSSPYGVWGGEDPGFPAQPGDMHLAKGTAVGSFVWMILPGAQRPCFHFRAGQGGHTKLEVNFLCRNASSRAKKKGEGTG